MKAGSRGDWERELPQACGHAEGYFPGTSAIFFI